jgi:pyruvate, water dikinase
VTVVSLDGSLDADLYGGKAAQLAIALRTGLPVPHGVALSVDFVEALAAGNPAASAELERVVALVSPPLAVRSSAVGEDSDTVSFAGQHATVLNVRSAGELASAIRAVCQSAHAESALAYRRRLGVEGAPRMAVVAQELVEADCAGVLFTQNPVDGSDEIVIEASWGLGEAVVAGLVTPDRFRLSRDGTTLECSPGTKDLAIDPDPGGGTALSEVPRVRVDEPCLDEAQLAELHALALRCEEAFGGTQDLEWAFAQHRLFLLQRRALTAAPVI